MKRKNVLLTSLAVSHLRAPGVHFVGGASGLALQVLKTGGRSWLFRFMLNGRRRDMGLGSYPEVSLDEARDLARNARKKVGEARNAEPGAIDPIEERRARKSAARAAEASSITFKECAARYIAAHEPGWRNPKHRAQWASTLKTYAEPVIGKLAVGDVALPHILAIVEPIWTEKTETASRVRGRIESVLDWATVRKYRTGENPARWKGHLDSLLPARSKVARREHHSALPVNEIGAFMERLRVVGGQGARALEFTILTAARSGEVRGAMWSEIDLDAKVWTVPAARMKAGREHRVPLSNAAVEILANAPRMDGSDLVFVASRGGQLSDMTLSAVLRRMDVDAVPHGFRSTFRDWAAERTGYPSEVAEMALAHTVGNKVEAAYRRGDLFEKRRRIMADWAKFLSRPQPASGATPMRARA
jgi:integrase